MKLRRKPSPEPMIFAGSTNSVTNSAKVKVGCKKSGTDVLGARKQDFRNNPLISRANSTGTRLSDSDSDELYLPAVNEAIRMLDLDSQATQTASFSVSTWSSSIGYCSSLLQQFVAKSQSGEPPPPPPQLPPILQLTKGARKCFSTLAEEPAVASSSNGTNELSRKALPTEASRGNMDHELGLDCHPSHVSPDSGIQSVAGSPFSVNSSPVHPGSHNGGSQHIPHQPVISSPCPPVPTPSPPPPPTSKIGKKDRTDSVKVTTAPTNAAARRRRSCRDTASTLSSGLQKDSSFVQAIQRGLDAALRLTAQTQHSDKISTEDSLVPCSRKRSRSCNRSTTKTTDSASNEITGQFLCSSKPPVDSSGALATLSRRHTKRKKKRKKQKSSQPCGQAAYTDPGLQNTLEQLCKTLDRCTISRMSTLSISAAARPWVFQCRKYPALAGGGGSSKSKRKKMEEDSAASKRRGKWKKSDAAGAGNGNGRGDSQAAVANAVELLLPLKKRHHIVPPYESLAPAQTSNCTTEEKCTEKASQEQVLTSRKRVANGELEPINQVETAAAKSSVPPSDDVVPVTAAKKKKLKRSKKKFRRETESPESDDLPTIEEIIASVTCKEPTKLEKKPPAATTSDITDEAEQPPKKKSRRRKAFNRTGFPSVKKKRKKLNPPILEEKKTVECHQPKRARFMKEEEDVADVADVAENLPELTSSESPSSDELAHLSLPSTEAEPKKRRIPSWRKRFLTAGLFSNFFKENPSTNTTSSSTSSAKLLTYVPEEHEYGLLPPPFHSERYLRRRRQDFQLPYNLWWLHQQGKLPGRDTMVPSWNYRKIRSNVYYDVKPPFTNDTQACNCTYPPPNTKGTLHFLVKTLTCPSPIIRKLKKQTNKSFHLLINNFHTSKFLIDLPDTKHLTL